MELEKLLSGRAQLRQCLHRARTISEGLPRTARLCQSLCWIIRCYSHRSSLACQQRAVTAPERGRISALCSSRLSEALSGRIRLPSHRHGDLLLSIGRETTLGIRQKNEVVQLFTPRLCVTQISEGEVLPAHSLTDFLFCHGNRRSTGAY